MALRCLSLHSLSNLAAIMSSHTSVTAASASALLLPTTPTVPFDSITLASLNSAAVSLRAGKLVAFPTETVYGLGASALSSSAVKQIFAAKGRPSDNPLIVHVASMDMLCSLLPGGRRGIPSIYEPLLARFWPGPLSLIFPLTSTPTTTVPSLGENVEMQEDMDRPENLVAAEVLAGATSLAVRMPSHPLALELIRLSGLPLAAPSANLSSRPSPTSALHVEVDLGTGRGVASILDGGECTVGVESTVVDWLPSTARNGLGEVRVLRAGGVSAEDIERCLSDAGLVEADERVKVYAKDFKDAQMEERPTTPGMKYKHYSPTNSRVILVRPHSTSASTDRLPTLQQLIESLVPNKGEATICKNQLIGLMFTSETLSRCNVIHLDSITPSCTCISLSSSSSTSIARSAAVLSYSIGSIERPQESAQRLFAGLRYLDSLCDFPQSALCNSSTTDGKVTEVSPLLAEGGGIILLECIAEEGVGLAVMERSRKAAGGGEVMDFRI